MKKIVLAVICVLLSAGGASAGTIFTDISSEINNQGVSAIGDVNGDGWADLLNNSGIWLNKGQIVNGRPTFQSVQQGLDFTTSTSSLSHMILVDIDGDGDKDLVASQAYGDVRLYRNDSCGTELRFVDITSDAGLGGNISHEQTHVALADIDRDGDLDIYATEGWPSGNGGVLYRNDTDATGIHFKNVAAASGIVAPPACRTILFVDFDGDGDADLFLGSHSSTNKNKFYLNQGDSNNDGVPDFIDVTEKAGLNYYAYDNGGTAGDIDNDGDMDIAQAVGESQPIRIFENVGDSNGDGIVDFIDRSYQSGIPAVYSHHGVGLGDMDNDGDLDLADASWWNSPLQIYSNDGDGTFTNITTQSGIGSLTYGVRTLFADIDNDGDLDLWMNKLFMNNTNNGAYLKVELLGKGLNRDAVGAKLRAWPAGTTHFNENPAAYREVTAGTAFFSSDDAILELGLTPGTYDIEATFMSGAVQAINGAATGQTIRILEDSSVFFPKKCGNHDPTADAGADQTVECGSAVTLDGSASSDPDGDTLTYSWKEGEVLLGSGSTLSPTLGLGDHTITLTVDDGNGGTSADDVKVKVQDTTPPQSMINKIAGTVGNNEWYRSAVSVTVIATDACSGVQEIHYSSNGGADTVSAGENASIALTQDGVNAISYYAKDHAGNTETPAHQHSVKIDQTAPEITATTAPPPNEYGWNKTDVVVTFACADAASGVASCTSPITVAAEEAGQTAQGTAVDQAGNEATVTASVSIDKTGPVITATVSPDPNQSGWHNTDVTVVFTCTDDISGVASCPAPITVTAEGAGQVITGAAADKAGNTATASVTLNIDKTQPLITVSLSRQPNASGWNDSDVTVTFTCSDTLSGIASCPAPVTVTTEGAGQVITGAAADKAGNTATVSVTLNIDKTPPTLSLTASPNLLWPPNHKMATVVVSGGSSDMSGIASSAITVADEYGVYNFAVPGFGSTIQLEASRKGSDADGRVYTITAVVTDLAGNQATATTSVLVPHDMGKKSESDDSEDDDESERSKDSDDHGRSEHSRKSNDHDRSSHEKGEE
jgi:hypothetical protein